MRTRSYIYVLIVIFIISRYLIGKGECVRDVKSLYIYASDASVDWNLK